MRFISKKVVTLHLEIKNKANNDTINDWLRQGGRSV